MSRTKGTSAKYWLLRFKRKDGDQGHVAIVTGRDRDHAAHKARMLCAQDANVEGIYRINRHNARLLHWFVSNIQKDNRVSKMVYESMDGERASDEQ